LVHWRRAQCLGETGTQRPHFVRATDHVFRHHREFTQPRT
jgi:hypothetical protein